MISLLVLAPACSLFRVADDTVDAARRLYQDPNPETVLSLVLAGAPEVELLIQGLEQFDVAVDFEMLETGRQLVQLVGAYSELVRAVQWIVQQGVASILGRDEVSEALLATILKSGGGRS